MWHFVGSKKRSSGFGFLWTDQDSVLLTSSQEEEMLKQEKDCGIK